jgi:hypothetical protein
VRQRVRRISCTVRCAVEVAVAAAVEPVTDDAAAAGGDRAGAGERCEVPRFSGGSRSWSDWAKGGADVIRPSKFAPEFRARAIDLYRSSEGRTIADVARELEIGTETLRKWVHLPVLGVR